MRLSALIFTFISSLFFLAPAPVKACSCLNSGTACEAFWNTEAVFSGEVKSISNFPVEKDTAGGKFTYQQKLVRFEVAEAFRGISGNSAEIMTGQGGGDCGFRFETGQSYLVYAYKNPETGQLGTGICSRTQLLSKATEDIEYFRSLATAKSGSTVYGKVVKRYARKEDEAYREPEPLPNILLAFTGKDGAVIETTTDEKGEYRLSGISPGEYKIRLKMPENLWGYEKEGNLKVYDKGCAASYFALETKTILSGQILNESSLPAADISVQLVPVDQINNRHQKDVQFVQTDNDGRFLFRSIPTGTYYLGVRLYRLAEPLFPYPRTFYPGTTDLESAKMITVSEGQTIGDINFNLPQKLSTRKIEGVVVYPDGSPAPNAMISIEESEYAEGSMGSAPTQTKADGSFSLSAMNGLRYLIKPVVAATDTPSRQRHAEPIEIPADGDVKNLKFVITEPNGNCDKCLRWTRKEN